jgi:hypothetical protein
MTPDEFRRIALSLDDAAESAHMGHPDFRANGRIFATLYPDGVSGMVKLTPDQQQDFMRADSGAFTPASGAWGRQGCTTVRLDSVEEETLGAAMTLAWQNTAKTRATANTKPRRTKTKKEPRKR